jgi:hypothetical protein
MGTTIGIEGAASPIAKKPPPPPPPPLFFLPSPGFKSSCVPWMTILLPTSLIVPSLAIDSDDSPQVSDKAEPALTPTE